MPAERNGDLPRGLSPAAKMAAIEFNRTYPKFVKKTQREVALKILVWGRSPSSETPVARKREEIRDALIEKGHYAEFSENIAEVDADLSQKTKEYAQAKMFDYIVVLVEDSPGAIAEVHDFCGDREIGTKMQVMAPRKYRDTYSGMGALKDLADATGGGAVFWYKPDDLEKCNVLGLAVRRAEAMRNLWFMNPPKAN